MKAEGIEQIDQEWDDVQRGEGGGGGGYGLKSEWEIRRVKERTRGKRRTEET